MFANLVTLMRNELTQQQLAVYPEKVKVPAWL
jgi:hypothetical protein